METLRNIDEGTNKFQQYFIFLLTLRNVIDDKIYFKKGNLKVYIILCMCQREICLQFTSGVLSTAVKGCFLLKNYKVNLRLIHKDIDSRYAKNVISR